MIAPHQAFLKRSFDIVMSIVGLTLTGWVIAIAWAIASIDTRANGLFTQVRVGRRGKLFRVLKIRTMHQHQQSDTTPPSESNELTNPEDDWSEDWSTVTTADDPRITRLGRFWRKTKIDELPQLFNVLVGQMSLVGPRPDVPGFADKLQGDDRIILTMRPGITGPATLKYRHEEDLLAVVDDPQTYNREVIFPDKVRLNKEYVFNWSFWKDLDYIRKTILRLKPSKSQARPALTGTIPNSTPSVSSSNIAFPKSAAILSSSANSVASSMVTLPTSNSYRPTSNVVVPKAIDTVITSDQPPTNAGRSFGNSVKRTLDIALSLIGLIVLSPIILLVAFAVLLAMGSPIFFRQTRPGLRGTPFTMIKFRTMRNQPLNRGGSPNDAQRLTRFGQFLRSTSLDELPELWNVFKGDMSLVGPRPLLMEYLLRYSARQARRHDVKPGMTGWAQVNGRNAISWADKFEHDVWYVEHRSCWLDLKIMLLTFFSVLSRRGVNPDGQSIVTPFEGNFSDTSIAPRRLETDRLDAFASETEITEAEAAWACDPELSEIERPEADSKICQAVLRHINQVLATSKRPLLESIEIGQSLQSDIGLDSLELAELTVRLESEFGVDIFREGIVRTVGEVLEKFEV